MVDRAPHTIGRSVDWDILRAKNGACKEPCQKRQKRNLTHGSPHGMAGVIVKQAGMAKGIVKQGGKKGVDATCKAVGTQPNRSDLRTRFVMAPKAKC